MTDESTNEDALEYVLARVRRNDPNDRAFIQQVKGQVKGVQASPEEIAEQLLALRIAGEFMKQDSPELQDEYGQALCDRYITNLTRALEDFEHIKERPALKDARNDDDDDN